MAKFSNVTRPARATAHVEAPARTHEGGSGFRYDARTELWNLVAASLMGNEKGFYESGQVRDERLAKLTATVVSQPDGFEWVSKLVPFLRNSMFMRTAPVVVAAEAVIARRYLIRKGSAPVVAPEFTVRRLVASAIGRMDEFAEFIGYWRLKSGRSIPGGVQRGLADAFVSMANEFNSLKYDGANRSYRIGDVVEILHPEPASPWQAEMFKFFIDRRHGVEISADAIRLLPMVSARMKMDAMPQADRAALVAQPNNFAAALRASGMTWENVSTWLGRKLTASEWSVLIPTMGYMALLRNLRNFDLAGVSDVDAAAVSARLMDPVQVEKGKQFPYRYYTAYRTANESFRWANALSTALELSLKNVPAFDGKTLVLVDTSGSMMSSVSEQSDVYYVDIAALFASALAAKGNGVDVVAFADSAYKVEFPTKTNVLRNVDKIRSEVGKVGYGTHVASAQPFLKDHSRIVVLSDMQDAGGVASGNKSFYRGNLNVPSDVKVYSFNLAGYGTGTVDTSKPGRYMFAGFSDAAFRAIPALERGIDQKWPFEV